MGNCPLGVAMSEFNRTTECNTENGKFNMNGKMALIHALLSPALAVVCVLCAFVGVTPFVWMPLGAVASIAFALLFSFARGYAGAVGTLISLAISAALGKSAILVCAFVLLVALTLTLAGRCSFRGFDAIMLLSVIIILYAGFVLGLDVYAKKEIFNSSAVREYIGDIRELIRQSYVDMMNSVTNIALEAEGIDPEAKQKALEALGEITSVTQSNIIAKLVIMVIPAYFGAAVTVAAYIFVWGYARVGKKLGAKLRVLTEPVMPRFLPIAFLVAGILRFFISSGTAVGLSLVYFVTFLTPCFAYFGIKTVCMFLKAARSKKTRIFIIAVLIILAISSLGYIINLLALFGAYTILRVAAFGDRIAGK